MTLRVTFLGTSAAIPTTERNPSSILMNREGRRLLFDVGEGTQRQMMRFGTGFTVSDVFITHLHGDHILGLPGLLETWAFMDRSEAVTIHCPPGTVDALRRFLFAIHTRPDYGVRLREVTPGTAALATSEFEVRAFDTQHDIKSVGYVLAESDRKGRFDRAAADELGIPEGPLFSKLHRGESIELEDGRVIEPSAVVGPPRPGRTVIYTGDTRPTSATIRAAESPDLLIHDATFTEDLRDRALETAHATAAEAGRIARQMGAHQLALTHFSSRYAGNVGGHRREAAAEFDGPVIVPHDGHTTEVDYPDA